MVYTAKIMKKTFIYTALVMAMLCLFTACGKKQGDYKYEKVDGGISITAYKGDAVDVVIPEKIDGKTVVALGEAVFDTSLITSIELPETVTKIGKYAFRRCGNLTKVVIKGKITEIPDGTFNYCLALEEFEIPDTVEIIGENAFGKAAIKSIKLPDSVKEIGDYAFYNCTALTSFEGGKGLESIGNNTFSGCHHLEVMKLEEGLKSLGEYALAGCTLLTGIELPNTVESLEMGVFAGIPFVEYTVPSSIKTIKSNVFSGCKTLEKIYIPDSVETMDPNIFVDCKGFVICGIRDSQAEIYADVYGFKFEEYSFS